MYGAETFGVEPVFSASKWKVNGCIDWDIDQQYILDYPIQAMSYLKRIKKEGKACMDCLWNDGDLCAHPQATVEEEVLAR